MAYLFVSDVNDANMVTLGISAYESKEKKTTNALKSCYKLNSVFLVI